MGIPIGTSADPVDTENMIDDSLWRGQALPTTVAPTFQTCNIERAYRVDVRVGLSYTDGAQIGAKVCRKSPSYRLTGLRANVCRSPNPSCYP